MNFVIPAGDAKGDVLPFDRKLGRRQRARGAISVDLAGGDSPADGVCDFQSGEQVPRRRTLLERRACRLPLAVVRAGEISDDEILCLACWSQNDQCSDDQDGEAVSSSRLKMPGWRFLAWRRNHMRVHALKRWVRT